MASSRFLDSARASNRFATLEQAINKTKPTAPAKIQIDVFESRTSDSCNAAAAKLSLGPNASGNFAYRSGRCIEFRSRLFESHAVFEPSRSLKVMTLVNCVRIELKRYPHFRGGTEILEIEPLADDSRDDIGLASQNHRLAGNGWVAREPSRPQPFANDRHRRSARRIFLCVEWSAYDERHAK